MTKLTKNLSKRKSKNQDWILPGDTNLELEYPIDAMTIPKEIRPSSSSLKPSPR